MTIKRAANNIMTIQHNTIQNRNRQDGIGKYETKDKTENERGWKKERERKKETQETQLM